MMPVLSRERMRELDRHAIEDCHVPSLVLMENAGRGACEIILRVIAERSGRATSRARVAVLCGPGNNGGDGFVVARRLRGHGVAVRVFLTTTAGRLQGDASLNHQGWIGIGGSVTELVDEAAAARLREGLADCDLVVDALFGTGLDREVTGRHRTCIELINASGVPCVALDIPSGLDANRGVALGAAVSAVATVTFAQHKLGLLCTQGAVHAGIVHLVDIGVPSELVEHVAHDAVLLESSDVAEWLRPRSLAEHKGSAGRVLAVCGSPGKTGAALLVGHAAVRAGAGLVTIASLPRAADALDQRVIEVMTTRIDPERVPASLEEALERTDVVVIGPGLGLLEPAKSIVEHVVFGWSGPKVVDADALTHLAGGLERLPTAPGSCLLTPHAGEMGRLLDQTAAEVEADRFGAVRRLVDRSGAVVLLKGPRTLVGAPGELPVVCSVDCPALATGGAGDVLAGVCAALACGLPLREAACCGAHLHGLSAARWSVRTGADRGLLAREVADGIPEALAAVFGTSRRASDRVTDARS